MALKRMDVTAIGNTKWNDEVRKETIKYEAEERERKSTKWDETERERMKRNESNVMDLNIITIEWRRSGTTRHYCHCYCH